MTEISIVRQPDDAIAKARVSLGIPHGYDGYYIVFRGEPEEVIKLMRRATAVAEFALKQGKYTDNRPLAPDECPGGSSSE